MKPNQHLLPRAIVHQICKHEREIKAWEDGGYRTTIDHDGHGGDCYDCAECNDELEALREYLPPGFVAEWTGNGNGTESDVHIYWEGD